MRTKEELIQNWLDKAAKDVLTVEHELSFENTVIESVCFQFPQAVESKSNSRTVNTEFFATNVSKYPEIPYKQFVLLER